MYVTVYLSVCLACISCGGGREWRRTHACVRVSAGTSRQPRHARRLKQTPETREAATLFSLFVLAAKYVIAVCLERCTKASLRLSASVPGLPEGAVCVLGTSQASVCISARCRRQVLAPFLEGSDWEWEVVSAPVLLLLLSPPVVSVSLLLFV